MTIYNTAVDELAKSPVFGTGFPSKEVGGSTPPSGASPFSNPENIRRAIQDGCTSSAAIIRYLGLRSAGGNHKTLKRWAEVHGIEIPLDKGAGRKPSVLPKTEDEAKRDYLVVEATCSRSVLKRSIIRFGWLAYLCHECGMTGEWNGKPLTLQIDHINGIFNDNRIENLRFLCPNCHSQTETFAGRRRGIEKQKQRKIRSTKIQWPEVKELANMVEKHGYSGCGRILGVSDNAVRKRLKTHQTN